MERTSWPLILLLYLAGLLSAMQFAKVSLTLGEAELVWRDAPVAFLVSAVAVVGVAAGALAGAFVARFGARPAILWALGLSGALSLLQALLPPFPVMLALRVGEGLGHLALVVALPTLMAARSAPSDRPVVMGLWGTFFGVGFAILGAVLPWAGGFGPGTVYAWHGVACLILLPVMWRTVPRIMTRGASFPGVIAIHRAIYGNVRLVVPGLAHGIYTSLFIALVALVPGALNALWLTPLLPLSNLAGTFASGFVARTVRPGHIATGAFLASCIGFAGTAALADGPAAPWLLLVTFAATGLLAGANFAAVPALNADPADQARANGGMAQMGNVGTFAGTPLLAAALASGGAGAVLLTAAAICAVGAIAAGSLYARAARTAA
ncbi:MFS transporter [Jannaschia sp. LMIT008]|uniref:MFS transporter n=1 Tax=Jannaschia maritima TaxID=3032585 RepID=UPI0028115B71|nr:MFS transporter [Jannaschia sp. LMIT008]